MSQLMTNLIWTNFIDWSTEGCYNHLLHSYLLLSYDMQRRYVWNC